MDKSKNHIKKVPPDGGWGWFIVLGSCLINISTIAVGPSFGLLFGGLLKQLGVETTGASSVFSTYESIINFSGLIVGPMIRKYSYRKVAIAGAVMCAAAFLLSATANSISHIIVTFGVLGGIGYGLAGSCWIVGINAYFSKKKGQAFGLATTGTVLGHMSIPHVVRILLDEYDFSSALYIIGALSLHAIVGACLFQPVSWHMKAVMSETEAPLLSLDKIENKSSPSPAEPKNGVRRNLRNPNLESREDFFNTPSEAFPGKESSISNVSLLDGAGNTFHIQEKTEEEYGKKLEKANFVIPNMDESHINNNLSDKTKNTITKSVKNQLSRFSKFMDLEILTDGVYLNIIYGISIWIATEVNCKLIISFFFLDLGFSNSEIAFAMSAMAVSDISGRLVVPPILDRITFPRRIIFLFCIVCEALARSCLALLTTRGPIITTFAVIGFFRGICYTSFPVVLAEYSCGNNFPSVLGLSMVGRGIFIVILGPLSGYIRDVTNSYPMFIHFQTILIISVFIAWFAEIIILKSERKKEAVIDDDLQKGTGDKII